MEIVYVAQEISANLIIRNSIRSLFRKIERIKSIKICVDFKNVKFTSLCSADEYLKLKNSSSKSISEKNMPANIEKMLEIALAPKENASLSKNFTVYRI